MLNAQRSTLNIVVQKNVKTVDYARRVYSRHVDVSYLLKAVTSNRININITAGIAT